MKEKQIEALLPLLLKNFCQQEWKVSFFPAISEIRPQIFEYLSISILYRYFKTKALNLSLRWIIVIFLTLSFIKPETFIFFCNLHHPLWHLHPLNLEINLSINVSSWWRNYINFFDNSIIREPKWSFLLISNNWLFLVILFFLIIVVMWMYVLDNVIRRGKSLCKDWGFGGHKIHEVF